MPYGATEADLRAHFSGVGEPSQIVIPVDRETGRPRGFAFVEFLDRAHAEEAINRFNQQPFMGRALSVSEARPREAGGGGGGGGYRPSGGGGFGRPSFRTWRVRRTTAAGRTGRVPARWATRATDAEPQLRSSEAQERLGAEALGKQGARSARSDQGTLQRPDGRTLRRGRERRRQRRRRLRRHRVTRGRRSGLEGGDPRQGHRRRLPVHRCDLDDNRPTRAGDSGGTRRRRRLQRGS